MLGRHLVHRWLALIGMADGAPSARYYVWLDAEARKPETETEMGATEADFLGFEFEEEGDGWGTGWIEVTVMGDEYRRFRKPDGEIVEVPFGTHTDEEDDDDGS